jgi:UDP-galactopyranose mutase
MSPDEARRFVAGLSSEPEFPTGENFEDAAIKAIGLDLYKAFMEGYTRKQWGRHPMRLPASVLKRLPLRFDYNDNAFFHKYQGMPRAGYTQMVCNMLTMSSVNVHLGHKANRFDLVGFDHVFYSGPIDGWFNYCAGDLPYRTLDFEVIRAEGDFQGCAVINNCDADTPWTRSTEHKHFTPWEEHKQTIVYREMPREARRYDIPFYPIRYAGPNEMLDKYETLAAHEDKMTFVGRLGTFQYLDMDKTIEQAIHVAKDFQRKHDLGI